MWREEDTYCAKVYNATGKQKMMALKNIKELAKSHSIDRLLSVFCCGAVRNGADNLRTPYSLYTKYTIYNNRCVYISPGTGYSEGGGGKGSTERPSFSRKHARAHKPDPFSPCRIFGAPDTATRRSQSLQGFPFSTHTLGRMFCQAHGTDHWAVQCWKDELHPFPPRERFSWAARWP